jgi:NAD(P)-dependent dehydrogenase (short-subunit alcohol dehydrogenase family)
LTGQLHCNCTEWYKKLKIRRWRCLSDEGKKVIASTPLGRLGTPGDIARVVVFLASDDSAWVTGEIIRASGGLK